MTIAGRRLTPWAAFWLAAAVASFLLAAHGASMAAAVDAGWAMQYPAAWRWPLNAQISAAMKWLVEEVHFHFFTFTEMTRGLAWLLKQTVADRQQVELGAHEAAECVLGRTDDRLAPDVERCVHEHRTAGPSLERAQ